METNYNYCLIGSSTDVGRVRKANEDSMDSFVSPNGLVLTVCDGMGGHVGGQMASQTAVRTIREFLTANYFEVPQDALYNAIVSANQAILNYAQAHPELTGMGSTCVLLLVRDAKVYYAHVGDSRIYLVANHRIVPLTKDHSFVQMLVDAGQITQEQAERHPRKNEITNALGIADMKPPTVAEAPIEPDAGNCFILCSDGLTGMVDDQRIERVVSKHEMPIQERADLLVKMANEAGGRDNITVELMEFAVNAGDIASAPVPAEKEKGRNKYLLPASILLAVVLGAAAGFYFSRPSGEPDPKGGAVQDSSRVEEKKEPVAVPEEKVSKEIVLPDAVAFTKGKDLTVKLPDEVKLSKGFSYTLETPDSTFVTIQDISEKGYVILHCVRPYEGPEVRITCTTEWDIYNISIPVKKKDAPAVSIPGMKDAGKKEKGEPESGKKTPEKKPAEEDPEKAVPAEPAPDAPAAPADSTGTPDIPGGVPV